MSIGANPNSKNASSSKYRQFDDIMARKDQAYLDSFNSLPNTFLAVNVTQPSLEDSTMLETSFDYKITVKPVSGRLIKSGPDGAYEFKPSDDLVPTDSLPDITSVSNFVELDELIKFYGTLDYLRASSNEPISQGLEFGQIVECKFLKGDANNGDAGRVTFDLPRSAKPVFHQGYVDLISDLQTNSAKEPFTSNPVALLGNVGNAGIIPNSESAFQPIKVEPATTSPREDGSFSKGQCPKCLTNDFKDLPRGTTTFYTYKREDVLSAIKKTQFADISVQKMMFAIMSKEQPGFRFPNNNLSGIQTDLVLFAGTTLTDFDYQTCFKDSETWRGFAGFKSLQRGVDAFAKILSNKASRRFETLAGDYETQADTMVWNYYRSWNLALTPEELNTLKETNQVTRGNTLIKRNWNKDKDFFRKKFIEFDEMN